MARAFDVKKLGDLRFTVPAAIIVPGLAIAFVAKERTIDYLSDYFMTKAEAQTISQKFAQIESKVGELSGKIDQQRISELEAKIFELRVSQCMAQGALKTLYANQLAARIGEWRQLTGRAVGDPPTLVQCGDIG